MQPYDIDALIRRLEALASPDYRAFSEGLIPGAENTSLGVRFPQMRSIAREIRKGDWRGFLESSRDATLFELKSLHGIVLGSAKCDIEEKIRLADAFLPYVDNWSVCDTLCSSFKPRADERGPLFDFVEACAASPAEFRKRFGLVMMMDYYRDDPYAERVMAAYRRFRHEGYYARMGAAWGLATLFLFQRDRVLEILRDGVLDDFTHGKAIQKIRESYRVSEADKALAAGLRRGRGLPRTTLCYIERDGRYLMLHRTKKKADANHDKWIGIGGHIEPDESPMDCMLREAREETGLTLLDCRGRGLVRFRSDEYPDEDMYLYSATRFEGELRACSEGDLEWIEKDRLMSLTLWEGDRIFLRLMDSGAPYFDLTLEYEGEKLARAALDGREMDLER